MAGVENKICFGEGYKLQPSSAQSLADMQRLPTDVGRINHTGDPEGVISANPSSLCHDPVSGNIYFKQTGTGNTGWVLIDVSGSDLHTAKFIVGDISNGANYSTIAAAYSAAVTAGGRQTVFLQDGTYTVNQTLSPGVNLCSFGSSGIVTNGSTSNCNIKGKLSYSGAGVVGVFGINLETNGDYCVEVTGSSVPLLQLTNCAITARDHSALHNTANGKLELHNCTGDIQDNTVNFFDFSGSAGIKIFWSILGNNAVSIVPSTLSGSGGLQILGSFIATPITTSGTSSFSAQQSHLTALVFNSTGANGIGECSVNGGTESGITIGASAEITFVNSSLYSSNTDAISNAGIINLTGISFSGPSSLVTGGTQNVLDFIPSAGGAFQSLAPYIVGSSNADFSTIQAAITAIISDIPDGQAANILVKPQSGGYNEDLDFTGLSSRLVNISALAPSTAFLDNESPYQGPVNIFGNHQVEGFVLFNDITLQNDSGSNPGDPLFMSVNTPNVALNGVGVILTSASLFGVSSGSTSIVLNAYNSQISQDNVNDSSLFDDAFLDAGLTTVSLSFENSIVNLVTPSTASKGDWTINALNCKFKNDITLSTSATVNKFNFYNSRFQSNLTSPDQGDFRFEESFIDGTHDINCDNLLYYRCFLSDDTTFPSQQPSLFACQNACGYMKVTLPPGDYTTLVVDDFVGADTTSARTITLYANPSVRMVQTIKDVTGNASSNNITIDGNGSNIEGVSTLTISENYGCVTLIFNGTEWNVIATNASGGGSFQSLAPFIVGASFANYATIQAAITAAVGAGATVDNQINVYIKNKGSAYVEDLAFAPGVNLIGFDPSPIMSDTFTFNPCSVTIEGNFSAPTSGYCKISNVTLQTSTGVIFDYSANARILLFNCFISMSFDAMGATSLMGTSNASVNAVLQMQGVNINDRIGSCTFVENATLGTSGDLTIQARNCRISIAGNTTIDHGSLSLILNQSNSGSSEFTFTGTSDFSLNLGLASSITLGTCIFENVSQLGVVNSSFSVGDMTINNTSGSISFSDSVFSMNTWTGIQPVLNGCVGCCGYQKVSTLVTGTYTTTLMDDFVPCDSSGGAFTVSLYDTPFTGMRQTFKDTTGSAASNNLTIDGNGKNIDGASTYVITSNYGSITLVYNGTEWSNT